MTAPSNANTSGLSPTDALRLVPEIRAWADRLKKMAVSIYTDGTPSQVGFTTDECLDAALFLLSVGDHLAAAPASPLPGGGDWIDGTPEVPVGSPTWCGWASYEIRRLRAEIPAAPTGDA